jgi:hypothetical protein
MIPERIGGMAEVRQRFERWRERCGGPGRRIPEALWSEAMAVARHAGVETTARTLHVHAERLRQRMELDAERPAAQSESPASEGFVELDAGALCLPGRAVLRLQGRDGEQLQLEMSSARGVDLLAVVRAFWSRPR